MIDLTSVSVAIDIYSRSLTLRRYPVTGASGLYEPGGDWEDDLPEPSSISFNAAAFAMNPNAVRDLPEGLQSQALFTIWSRSDILAEDNATGRMPDEVLIDGVWFRVLFVWPRREGGYTKAALGAVDERGRTV